VRVRYVRHTSDGERANRRRSLQSDLKEGRGGGHRSRLIVRLIGFRLRLHTVHGPSGRLPSATMAGPRGIAHLPALDSP